MKKFMKKAVAAVMVLTLAVGMMTGCSTSKDLKTKNAKKVLFTYDKTDVTLQEAWIYTKMSAALYDSYYGAAYGSDFWMMPVGSDEEGNPLTMEDMVKKQIINNIKMICVLNNKASEYKVELTEDEKAKCAEYAKAFAETPEGSAILKECGASEEDMVAIYEKNKIASKVQAASIADVQVDVTDDEARESKIARIVYATSKTDENGQTLDMTDEEKAEAKKKAEDALAQIKGGSALEDVAKTAEYANTSETFAAGESEEGVVFEEKLASMKDGELMPEVMECDNGYVVAQLVAYTDAEATASNKETIAADKKQHAFEDIYAEWTKDLEAEWNDETSIDQALLAEIVLHSEESTATDAVEETQPAADEAAEATTAAK